MFFILLTIIIIIGVVFLILGIVNRKKSTKNLLEKGVFVSCKNNFDCNLGFLCELRNHPNLGICVIAPGGACHETDGRDDACYSGFYCDKQDGVCLKTEN
jgi:hypothetical protein